MKTKFIMLSVLGMLLTSCAAFGPKMNREELARVQKVAIVAVEIQQQLPTDNSGVGAIMQISKGGKLPGQTPELQGMAKNITNSFMTELQKKTGWQMLALDKMTANPEYKAKYAKEMTGMRQTMMVAQSSEGIYPNNILDGMAFRKMTLEERKNMAKALGVDAIAELIIYNKIDQSWIALGHLMGEADFTYSSSANFQLYGLNSEDPIWRIQNVQGEKTVSSGTLSKSMNKMEKMSKLGQEATSSATSKLIEKYSF